MQFAAGSEKAMPLPCGMPHTETVVCTFDLVKAFAALTLNHACNECADYTTRQKKVAEKRVQEGTAGTKMDLDVFSCCS